MSMNSGPTHFERRFKTKRRDMNVSRTQGYLKREGSGAVK